MSRLVKNCGIQGTTTTYIKNKKRSKLNEIYSPKDQLFKSQLAQSWVNLKFRANSSNSMLVNLKVFLQASCLDQFEFSSLTNTKILDHILTQGELLYWLLEIIS